MRCLSPQDIRRVAGIALAAPTLALVLALNDSATVFAQDCGAWSRPVVCRAELVAAGDDGNVNRLDDRSRYRIAPRAQVDLLLDARDQRGRPFPDDRLALQYDASRCGRLLNVEGRNGGLRITARSDAARCRMLVWVPGNLNFEWEIEFEVDPAVRTGYSRPESEYLVRSLYRAVLEREPDGGSVRGATAEIQQGNLDNLINSMLRSSEFQNSLDGVSAEALLDRFYQGLFGRPTDTGGVREYLGSVRSRQYSVVLLRMIRSTEFERRLSN